MEGSLFTIISYQLNNKKGCAAVSAIAFTAVFSNMEYISKIEQIKGVGEKTAALFHRLNIYTVGELLHYYPRVYDVYEEPVSLKELAEADEGTVSAVICEPLRLNRAGRMQITTGKFMDAQGEIMTAKWFHMPYLCSTFKKGMHVVLRGRLKGSAGRRSMEQPEMMLEENYRRQLGYLHPVYGLTAGLGNKTISKVIRQALDSMDDLPETLPKELLNQYELMEYGEAICQIHFPGDKGEFEKARKRLVFEEFYRFITGVRQMKERVARLKNHFAIVPRYEMKQFMERLPYQLTGAQMRTWQEILSDMTGAGVMNRMVQGDVGSGKTIVAILAMYLAGLCGYQSVMMAPTAVLAGQHYENICRLFAEQGISLRAALLTGSVTGAKRRELYRQIADHEIDIVIGTHALIQEKVIYKELALVITDEQHRFGVNQREMLSQKGLTPHVLVMSATPIPRSLAIILYGDLDMSVIDEKPAKRLPVKTCSVGISYRNTAYKFMQKEITAGHQVYVICPMVEESEVMEGENVGDYAEKLRTYFSPLTRIEILHGKMKQAQKDEIMAEFSEGHIQILVSTTVIEVGIDVANATVILIEDAQRFGLAQLHQLRGRVGRGTFQSYCILINTSGSKESKKRLDILNQSNDGFYIASEDLKLRGPGDFFGVRQSGELQFRLGDVYTDAEILKQAAEAAERFPI